MENSQTMIQLSTFLKLLLIDVIGSLGFVYLLYLDNSIHGKPRKKPEPKEKIIFKRKDTYPFE